MGRILWMALAGVGIYLLLRARPQRYHPSELYNLFWDAENNRWRTDDEVKAILREHPEMAPEPLLEVEARVLSYLQEIEAASKHFSIQPGLICAIIAVESDGDWTARGEVGEYGLMQVRGTTAQMMGYTGDWDGLLNPSVNIFTGTNYLRYQLDRYADRSEPVKWAVAAYNTGTAYYEDGKFRNQSYVDRVMNRWPRYQRLVDRIHGVY